MGLHLISWRCAEHGATEEPMLLGNEMYCPADGCSAKVVLEKSPALAKPRNKREFGIVPKDLKHGNRPGETKATCISALAIHCARCSTLIPPGKEFVGIARGFKREDVCVVCGT